MAGDSSEEVRALQAIESRMRQLCDMLETTMHNLDRERLAHHDALEVLLQHLQQIGEHQASTERVLAGAIRMEGNLREGVADAHRLVDKLPGRRRQ